jgi:hypothetical protein
MASFMIVVHSSLLLSFASISSVIVVVSNLVHLAAILVWLFPILFIFLLSLKNHSYRAIFIHSDYMPQSLHYFFSNIRCQFMS